MVQIGRRDLATALLVGRTVSGLVVGQQDHARGPRELHEPGSGVDVLLFFVFVLRLSPDLVRLSVGVLCLSEDSLPDAIDECVLSKN